MVQSLKPVPPTNLLTFSLQPCLTPNEELATPLLNIQKAAPSNPSNTPLPRAAGMCDADGDAVRLGGRRSDICFCSQGSVCLLVSGSTEPSASHPRALSSCETTTRPDARPLLPLHPLLFSCVVRNYAQRAAVDNKRRPVCFSC